MREKRILDTVSWLVSFAVLSLILVWWWWDWQQIVTGLVWGGMARWFAFKAGWKAAREAPTRN